MCPVVFLDLNGTIGRFVPKSVHVENACLYTWWPESIANLNQLTDLTGAQIVVTSTLRRGKSLRFIRKLLRNAGVVAEVRDLTPWDPPLYMTRAAEIEAWLECCGPAAYVIFDDLYSIALPGFIRVGFKGITEADVKAATEHLKVP